MTVVARSCPGLWLSPLEFLLAMLSRAVSVPSWPQLTPGGVALTQSARTAVSMIAAAGNLSEGDEVLVPAYNCGAEIDALLTSGLQVRLVDCEERGFLTLDG